MLGSEAVGPAMDEERPSPPMVGPAAESEAPLVLTPNQYGEIIKRLDAILAAMNDIANAMGGGLDSMIEQLPAPIRAMLGIKPGGGTDG